MKKIMFNDKYGLTDAVLHGRKTMTRRMVPNKYISDLERGLKGTTLAKAYLDGWAYRVGDVVAVAQSYEDLGYSKEWVEQHITPNPNAKPTDPFEKRYPGWRNKMFVRADLMPHQIKITEINVERLQDISEEDCLKEGITNDFTEQSVSGWCWRKDALPFDEFYCTPREAFAALIDKVSGKGTWEKNPWVFAYSFKLIN